MKKIKKVHLVYPVGKIIKTPDAIGRHLKQSIEKDYQVTTYNYDEYKIISPGSADVLRIYIWAGVFIFLGVASFKWLVAENLQHFSFYLYTIGSIVNIGCNWFLIPVYGINGAALATFVSYGIGSYGGFIIFRKSRSNFLMATQSFSPYGVYKRFADRELLKFVDR